MPHAPGEPTWEDYYAAHAGREPRPLLVEVFDRLGTGAGRKAVDLGCGDGTDALALLDRGWTVLAIDAESAGLDRLRARTSAASASRLTVVHASFADVRLPAASLVHAGFSLPFCHPRDFPAMWAQIRGALAPGGTFAGQLFGDHDSWAVDPDMTCLRRAELDALFADWSAVDVRERDEDGTSLAGPKHWHVFDVIARV